MPRPPSCGSAPYANLSPSRLASNYYYHYKIAIVTLMLSLHSLDYMFHYIIRISVIKYCFFFLKKKVKA
jgi:hypothetical protein